MASVATTVSHDLDRDVTTVEATGTLTLQTAPAMRATLRKCLAECPSAVIVDVSGSVCAEPAALAVFAASARNGGTLPYVPLIICGASDDFLRGGRALLGSLACYATRDEAVGAAATARLGHHRDTFQEGRSLAAPGRAREAVSRLCDAWGIGHIRERASLVVSELVTNAVLHAASDVTVETVLRADFLHIRVRDGSSALPVVADGYGGGGHGDDHGRGLPIVARVSSAWGYHLNSAGDGKAVWATLRTRDIRPPAPMSPT